VALGAAAGLKPKAEEAVKDAYDGIKTLILRKYGDVGLDAVERKPASKSKKDSLAEDLADAGAADDEELLRQAKALTQLVEEYAPKTAGAIGIKLADIRAIGSVKVEDLIASGAAARVEVDARNVEAGGDVVIKGLQAKGGEQPDPK